MGVRLGTVDIQENLLKLRKERPKEDKGEWEEITAFFPIAGTEPGGALCADPISGR